MHAEYRSPLRLLERLCESVPYQEDSICVWKHVKGFDLDIVSMRDLTTLLGWHQARFPGWPDPDFASADREICDQEFTQSFIVRQLDEPILRIDLLRADYHPIICHYNNSSPTDYVLSLQAKPNLNWRRPLLKTGWLAAIDYFLRFDEVTGLYCQRPKKYGIVRSLFHQAGFEHLKGENRIGYLPKPDADMRAKQAGALPG